MRIKKNDIVIVLTGRDAGHRGKILDFLDNRTRVRVEGANIVKRHVKPGQDPKTPQGGIIEVASPMHISNVRLVCKHCNEPTRVVIRKLGNQSKVRYCKKCNESLDK